MQLIISSKEPEHLMIDEIWVSTERIKDATSIPFVMTTVWDRANVELGEFPYGFLTNLLRKTQVVPIRASVTKENVLALSEIVSEKAGLIRHSIMLNDDEFKEFIDKLFTEMRW